MVSHHLHFSYLDYPFHASKPTHLDAIRSCNRQTWLACVHAFRHARTPATWAAATLGSARIAADPDGWAAGTDGVVIRRSDAGSALGSVAIHGGDTQTDEVSVSLITRDARNCDRGFGVVLGEHGKRIDGLRRNGRVSVFEPIHEVRKAGQLSKNAQFAHRP